MDIVPADPAIDLTAPDTTPESTDDGGSLADHESEFNRPGRVADGPIKPAVADAEDEGLSRDEREAIDKTGKFARHRAGSQKATPEDVAQINALTKELRAKEGELAKIRPDALSGSPRLRTLQRQIKAIESELADSQPKPEPKREVAPLRLKPTSDASTFDIKEPEIEDFASDPDPYKKWTQEWNRWDRKKDAFEAKQAESSAQAEREQGELAQSAIEDIQTFAQRTPDFVPVTERFWKEQFLPPNLLNAIVGSDNRGQLVYHLAQRPDLVDELVLWTDGRELSDLSVAIVQRRLTKELSQSQAATTRSAAPPRTYTPPPPPNLVRTGPIKSGEELPDDESSLADHERAFNKPRRR